MAWNDPQWGKKNEGPPDLDELWRRFTARLKGLFGGRKTPGGNSGPNGFGAAGLGIVAAIIVAVWLASGFYIVNTGERGVVLRFGKFIETTQPGPNWHLPWPIESVQVVNIEQVRTVEIGYRNNVKNKMLKESLMLTDDENIIDIQFAVQYTLKDPEDYLFNNRSPDDAVRQVAESVMSEIVGKSKMDYVLYEGRADVAARATRHIQDALDRYKTGISISKVTMQNAQPPQEVQGAFDDAVKAGQDRERLKSEGQAYANDVIPKARGMAARLAEEAAGYKQSVIANAEGDASRFKQILVEYSKAPVVTRERMYQDMMQQVLSNTTKVLVDSSKGGNNLLYLPLDKLMHMSGQGTSPAPVMLDTTPKPGTAPTTQDDSHSRNTFRSRDREDRP
ncbi:protease modulator HflK [Sulfuriferula plumbiphila]|uniref:Protein HflK n=1 Tax=Sulfuriferula plumbiphila TaxID=171865 RepID=A0A512L5K2_9PROT|nr:FtsH protease activity modulator HflK [Sulfuriferula plumbiphila]BBP03461.1 protease modulator HflK [Sulfuriferula plumbiphila]GEP29768.1 protease modulator HflK [Sulfuriferula plumbiphila]